MQLIYADDASLSLLRKGDLLSRPFRGRRRAVTTTGSQTLPLLKPVYDNGNWQSGMHARYLSSSFLCVYSDFLSMQSIRVRSTILSHIAVSIALGGQGEDQLPAAKQEFNRVFLHKESTNNCLLLLIKVFYRFTSSNLINPSRLVVYHHLPRRRAQ